MSRRRVAAALFFSAVVLATLGLIVYTDRANAEATVSVWVVQHDVVAGARYSAGDVLQSRVPVTGAGNNEETRGPGQLPARYGHALHAGDVVRVDDLVAMAAVTEVVLALQDPPPIAAGDSIDIFAALPGARQARVGHAITVVNVSGTSVDVLVPAGDEAAWVALAASTTQLHAARTQAATDSEVPPLSAAEGINLLCGAACATASTEPSPQP